MGHQFTLSGHTDSWLVYTGLYTTSGLFTFFLFIENSFFMSLLGIVQSYKYSSKHNSKANRSNLDTSSHLLLIFLVSNFWVKFPTRYLGWVEPGYCFLKKKSLNKNFKRSKRCDYWHFMLSSSSILQPETENTEISNRTVCTWTSPN